MAFEEQITETIEAGAPSIKYEGDIQQQQQIAQELWENLPPQVQAQFGSFEQFFSSGAWKKVLQALQQQMQQGQQPQQMAQGPQQMAPQPQEGIGSMMPAQMAYGGIAGPDGRRAYGIGSWFQKKIMDPIKGAVKSPLGKIAGAAALGYGLNKFGPTAGWWDTAKEKAGQFLGSEAWKGSTDDGSKTTGGLKNFLMNPNFLIPAAGLVAGTFAKKDDPGYTGQGTGLNIRDVGRIANITDPKTAMASGLRFSPDVETRKFTPEEMLQSYAATDAENFSTPGAAQGGRIGYQDGGSDNTWQGFLASKDEWVVDPRDGSWKDVYHRWLDSKKAEGGRIGYDDGGMTLQDDPWLHKQIEAAVLREENKYLNEGKIPPEFLGDRTAMRMFEGYKQNKKGPGFAEGGLMSLGGNEMDLRGGGFVPIGEQEKADDVPARLSKNEFVFTADAVRAAGGGDVDAGADKMYNTMKQLENRVG